MFVTNDSLSTNPLHCSYMGFVVFSGRLPALGQCPKTSQRVGLLAQGDEDLQNARVEFKEVRWRFFQSGYEMRASDR